MAPVSTVTIQTSTEADVQTSTETEVQTDNIEETNSTTDTGVQCSKYEEIDIQTKLSSMTVSWFCLYHMCLFILYV